MDRSFHVAVEGESEGLRPAIIALHGKGDNGRDFLDACGLAAANTIVAAPTGSGLCWAPAPYARTTLSEDRERVNAVREELIDGYGADPERVYLVGFSNGGGLAVELSLLDDHWAGVATVSAAVRATPEQIAAASWPVDYVNIHGTYDDVVPFAGEQRSPYSGAEDDTTYGAPVVVDAFERRNAGLARAELRRVEGMGHEWPTGAWAARRGVDVAEVIHGFFGLDG